MSARRGKTAESENRTKLAVEGRHSDDNPAESHKPTGDTYPRANPYLRTLLLQSKLQLMLFEHNEQLRRKNQEIADSRRRFVNLFNLAPVGYLTLDPDNKIVEANIASATILMISSKDLSGKDFIQFVAPDYLEAFWRHRKQSRAGSRESFELGLVTSMGRPLHAKIESYMNSDMRWLIAVMDISARKRAEDELRVTRDKLSDAYEQVRAETIQRQRAEEELRKFTQKLIDVQEIERHRISQELHDHVGQLMTYLGLLLDKSRSQLDPDTFREAKSVAREVLIQIRDLSSDLQPSMLSSVGLLPSLRALFDRFGALTKIRVEFDCNHSGNDFPHDKGTAAYRIIQEALTNVARHTTVDVVTVRLGHQHGRLRIEVEDHGKGFDPISARGCTGLTSMRERAQAAGGTLVIESAPGKGTRVVANLPLLSLPSRGK